MTSTNPAHLGAGHGRSVPSHDRARKPVLHVLPQRLVRKEIGPNETELTLHHVGFPNDESRGNHEGGWARIAELLSKVVS